MTRHSAGALGAALTASLWMCGGGETIATSDAGIDAPAAMDVLSSSDVVDASIPVDAVASRYQIDLTSTSVSGISSGGFMAVQFHVAFSSIMKGVAVFAGGPYMCSQGSLTTALTTCAAGSPAPNVAALVSATSQNAQSGAIDPTSALAMQRVFIFGGADDFVVNPVVVDATNAYYASYAPSSAIQYVSRRPGTSHTWPTLSYGNPCDELASPYIGDCSYDGAGTALQQIYGTLSAPATTLSGTFVTISQGDYIADPASHSLDATAYAYVPASCASGSTCKIHVAFHGCLQAASVIGDAFYRHGGLNEWADTNEIIVVYPQTIESSSNPEACWDFWGYDSPDFAKKTGPQMAMVRAMLGGLAK